MVDKTKPKAKAKSKAAPKRRSKTKAEIRREKARQSKILTAQNRAKAVAMRKDGGTYHMIGARLGMSAQAAHKTILVAMREVKLLQDADAEVLQAVELEKLNDIEAAMWPGTKKGNSGSARAIIKAMERRAAMLGTDKPKKVAATDSDGKDLPDDRKRLDDMSKQEIQDRIAELRGKVDDGSSRVH